MNLHELCDEMKAIAIKNPQRISGGDKICVDVSQCELVDIDGRKYAIVFTYNILEEVPFWQITINDPLNVSLPNDVVKQIVDIFLGTDKKDIMEITHLLPKLTNHRCFVRRLAFDIKGFLETAPNIMTLKGEDKERALKCETLFTSMVDKIRKHSSENISSLGNLFHELVRNCVCPVFCVDSVETLSFWAEIKNPDSLLDKTQSAAILMPFNFLDLVEKELEHEMGAIVFIASKARDYWNGKITGGVSERASAYESEYLHSLNFVPNKYQQTIMEKYPLGLKSLPAKLHYESTPFNILKATMEFSNLVERT